MANQATYSGRGTQNPQLRVGTDERDAVVEILRSQHLAGRIDDDEFDERLAHCLTARTRADLDALIADLPADRAQQPELHRLVRPQRPWAFFALPVILLAIVLSHGRAVGLLVPFFFLIMRPVAWHYRSAGYGWRYGTRVRPRA